MAIIEQNKTAYAMIQARKDKMKLLFFAYNVENYHNIYNHADFLYYS